MGARYLKAWASIVILLVILPLLLSSGMALGYPLIIIISLVHTLGLALAARAPGKSVLWIGLVLALVNLISLEAAGDVSALHWLFS